MFVRPAAIRRLAAVAFALLAFGAVALAHAVPLDPDSVPDRLADKPKRLEGLEIREQLGGDVPLDTPFVDSSGAAVTLHDFFDGKHPVILTLNYAECPMLCGLQLPRLVEGLKQLSRTVGDDFKVLTISIDPLETPEKAEKNRQRYLRDYGRPEAKDWHFLTGPEAQTRRVANAVGIDYAFNEERKEWIHPASVVLLTPDGKISRYLYGIEYNPETLNLAIVEASEGKIGSIVDRLVLYCFHYDESEGRYAPVAMNIMRVGAGLAAVVLGTFLSAYWLSEYRRRKRKQLALSSSPSTAS
jgi:protein SCO1/2